MRSSLLAVLIGAMLAAAQEPNSAPNSARPAVYIVEFITVDTAQKAEQPGRRYLGRFATTLAELKLVESDDLEIKHVSILPVCGSEQTEQPVGPSQAAFGPRVDGKTPYYVIRGSIESRTSETQASPARQANGVLGEMVLNYELSKVVDCTPQPLVRRSSPFRHNNALETLSLMSDMLALRLKNAVTERVKVDIQQIELTGQSPDEIKIATALGDAIVQRLGHGGNYEPQDVRDGKAQSGGEYIVRTKLQVRRRLKPFLLRSDISGATVEFSILGGGNVLWNKTIPRDFPEKGPKSLDDQFASLYGDVAEAILSGLSSVRSARAANIDRNLTKADEQELRSKADNLLCNSAESGCRPQPEAALPLLIELAHRTGQGVDAVELLAQTQSQLGNYLEAAQSFDQASTLAVGQPPQRIIHLLNQSGDAWYHAQNYVKAAEKYKAALDESARNVDSLPPDLQMQPDLQLQLARSLRFGGERQSAFRSLLGNTAVVNDPTPFNLELRELIASMRPDELTWAEAQIGASQNRGLDSNVRAVLYAQMATQDLRTTRDLNKADDELRKAEAIPQDTLSTSVRAMVLRSRGEWFWYDAKWKNAEPLLQQVLALDETSASRHELALFYYEWASVPDQDKEKVNEHWSRAAEVALPLVERRTPDATDEILRYADNIYRNSNHHLGKEKDRESKNRFQNILERHPGDPLALSALMGVCTDYLQDFTCSLEAAEALDKIGIGNNAGDLLDVAEIYVLSGHYDEALIKIEPVTADPAAAPVYHVVAHFYRTWALLGKGDTKGAEESAKLWKNDIAAFRKQGGSSEWVFGGAPLALENERKVSENYKTALHKMMNALNDPAAPLPIFPH